MSLHNRTSQCIPGRPPWETTGNGSLAVPKKLAATKQVSYYCRGGHKMTVTYASNAEEIPLERDCQCGLPAGLDPANPPQPPRPERYRTHLEYVKERRKPAERKQILAEALERAATGGFAR